MKGVTTLTFDIFGTVLDLAGSLTPPLEELLNECGVSETVQATDVWAQWRHRQRIEQYQDNLLMLGHSGYLADGSIKCSKRGVKNRTLPKSVEATAVKVISMILLVALARRVAVGHFFP